MTAIPPVGAGMPPVAAEATPAAAGTEAAGDQLAGDQLQVLLGDLNEGQFFSGPELLGGLGAQGNAVLRDFLGRLKQADANFKDFKNNMKAPESGNAEAGDTGAPLHGGPAREPFERGGSQRGVTKAAEKAAKMMNESADMADTLAEVSHVAALALGTTRGINQLIKGQ